MAGLYWFKARKQGVGWVPSSWQGWIILALYFGILIYSFFQIDGQTHSVSDTLINFFYRFLILTAGLTVVTYLKGEPTTWHHHPDPINPPEEPEKEILKNIEENKE